MTMINPTNLLDGFFVDICRWPNQVYQLLFEEHHYLGGPLAKGTYAWVVTDSNGRPAGFDASLPARGRILNRWREHRLVVLPEFRRQGVGRALSEYVGDYHLGRGQSFSSTTESAAMGDYRDRSPLWKPTRWNHKARGSTSSSSSRQAVRDVPRYCHLYVGRAHATRSLAAP